MVDIILVGTRRIIIFYKMHEIQLKFVKIKLFDRVVHFIFKMNTLYRQSFLL